MVFKLLVNTPYRLFFCAYFFKISSDFWDIWEVNYVLGLIGIFTW